jgi:hypothetical protein
MQNRVFAALCAAFTLTLPAFAANGVENWYGAYKGKDGMQAAAKYQEAVKKYYEQSLAGKVPSSLSRTAFTPPTGVIGRVGMGGDYFNEMVGEDGGQRWSYDQMPLRVYIGRGGAGFRDNFPSLFASAMDEWSRASGGRIKWTRVNDPQSANILANWDANNASIQGEAGDTRTQFGFGPEGQRFITSAQVSLMPANAGAAYTDEEMHKICLHEIGHALGLHHSSTQGDIMYFQSNPAQISALGPRDAATIQRLYRTVQ